MYAFAGVESNVDIISLCAGENASTFVTDSGKVYSCGENEENRLGLDRPQGVVAKLRRQRTRETAVEEGVNAGEVRHTNSPFPAHAINCKGKHIICVSIGPKHSVAIDSFGLVYCWGQNNCGQLGTGDTKPRKTAVHARLPGVSDSAKHCDCGDDFTIIGTHNNVVYGWGDASHCSLGMQSAGNMKTSKEGRPYRSTPFEIRNNLHVADICCTGSKTLLATREVQRAQRMESVGNITSPDSESASTGQGNVFFSDSMSSIDGMPTPDTNKQFRKTIPKKSNKGKSKSRHGSPAVRATSALGQIDEISDSTLHTDSDGTRPRSETDVFDLNTSRESDDAPVESTFPPPRQRQLRTQASEELLDGLPSSEVAELTGEQMTGLPREPSRKGSVFGQVSASRGGVAFEITDNHAPSPLNTQHPGISVTRFSADNSEGGRSAQQNFLAMSAIQEGNEPETRNSRDSYGPIPLLALQNFESANGIAPGTGKLEDVRRSAEGIDGWAQKVSGTTPRHGTAAIARHVSMETQEFPSDEIPAALPNDESAADKKELFESPWLLDELANVGIHDSGVNQPSSSSGEFSIFSAPVAPQPSHNAADLSILGVKTNLPRDNVSDFSIFSESANSQKVGSNDFSIFSTRDQTQPRASEDGTELRQSSMNTLDDFSILSSSGLTREQIEHALQTRGLTVQGTREECCDRLADNDSRWTSLDGMSSTQSCNDESDDSEEFSIFSAAAQKQKPAKDDSEEFSIFSASANPPKDEGETFSIFSASADSQNGANAVSSSAQPQSASKGGGGEFSIFTASENASGQSFNSSGIGGAFGSDIESSDESDCSDWPLLQEELADAARDKVRDKVTSPAQRPPPIDPPQHASVRVPLGHVPVQRNPALVHQSPRQQRQTSLFALLSADSHLGEQETRELLRNSSNYVDLSSVGTVDSMFMPSQEAQHLSWQLLPLPTSIKWKKSVGTYMKYAEGTQDSLPEVYEIVEDLIVTSGGNNHALLQSFLVSRFRVIRSTARSLAFCNKLRQLEIKYTGLQDEQNTNHPFRLGGTAGQAGWRDMIAKRILSYPAMHSGPVRISLGFHAAPNIATANAILEGNFAVLSKRDAGFYGQGIYFSLDAHYCMDAYASTDEGTPLLFCAVIHVTVFQWWKGPRMRAATKASRSFPKPIRTSRLSANPLRQGNTARAHRKSGRWRRMRIGYTQK